MTSLIAHQMYSFFSLVEPFCCLFHAQADGGSLIYNSASFDWSSTTPLSNVGSYIQNAFWNCGKDFSLISSRGFVPLDNVRVSSDDLSFIEELPTLPEPLLQYGLIKRLRAGDVLSDVQIEDIVTMLEKSKKTRTPVQLVSQSTPNVLARH